GAGSGGRQRLDWTTRAFRPVPTGAGARGDSGDLSSMAPSAPRPRREAGTRRRGFQRFRARVPPRSWSLARETRGHEGLETPARPPPPSAPKGASPNNRTAPPATKTG